MDRITDLQELKTKIKLTHEEESFFEQYSGAYPFAVTGYYMSLIDKSSADDPVRNQCIPKIHENTVKKYESEDPLAEQEFSPVPGLIHRYKNRALILLTDVCAVHCRHCFRRNYTGKNSGFISKENFKKALEYISNEKSITEILLSGGDPLTLSNKMLKEIFERIAELNRELIVRVCTRIPVVMPERVDDELINAVKTLKSVWVVTQFNHFIEITEQSTKAVSRFINSGIPVLNQTVLLKGINDSKTALKRLFEELVLIKVKPFYIFQGDLACGTGHFRVNLSKGAELIRDVYNEISGLARPVYAVDLPAGGGKIILELNKKYISENGFYTLYDKNGKKYCYPDE